VSEVAPLARYAATLRQLPLGAVHVSCDAQVRQERQDPTGDEPQAVPEPDFFMSPLRANSAILRLLVFGRTALMRQLAAPFLHSVQCPPHHFIRDV
jgi:hypothetical protein